MSLLRKRRSASMKAKALVVTGALGAFQALAIVGAGSAAAVAACSYNPTTDTVTVVLQAPGDPAVLEVDDGTVVSDGAILLNGAVCSTATNTNTTSIVVQGNTGNEQLFIDNATFAEFATSIAWDIDLGAGTNDVLFVIGADGVDNTVTVTDTTLDLNGGTGTLAGTEFFVLVGGDGADTLDGSGLTDGVLIAAGNDGDDTITGGPNDDSMSGDVGNDTLDGRDGDDTVDGGADDDTVLQGTAIDGNDALTGGAGVDTLDYGGRTGAIIVDAPLLGSGEDANADGDLGDAGDEVDTGADTFEVFVTGTGNDMITGDADDETIVPGDGDDEVDGDGGTDTVDYSTSSAAVVIDPAGGTATGQGADTLANVEAFVGSDFDDTLIFDGGVAGFDGGAGIDTVDASAETADAVIDLTIVAWANVENAIGGSGNDTITGNDASNTLSGGDGNDHIMGGLGNDWIEGNGGNDFLDGEEGADTVSYENSPAGVQIDNSLLFASGDGDDAFGTPFEVIVGSAFDDQILVGQTAFTTNQRVKGKAGNDTIVGSNGSDILGGGKGNDDITGGDGSDTIKGSGGNDNIRSGSGDDTIKAGGGNDRMSAGSGDDLLKGGKGNDSGNGGSGDDHCTGVEHAKSC